MLPKVGMASSLNVLIIQAVEQKVERISPLCPTARRTNPYGRGEMALDCKRKCGCSG
jgi:hypothetical protein